MVSAAIQQKQEEEHGVTATYSIEDIDSDLEEAYQELEDAMAMAED